MLSYKVRMIYRNRPRPEYLALYAARSTKAIRFPDHVVRLVDLSAFEWAVLNWMIDGEHLTLDRDILPIVLHWSRQLHPSEAFINESFRELLDWYLHDRVLEWGPQTIDNLVRRYAA